MKLLRTRQMGAHAMNNHASLHRQMDALTISLVDGICRTGEMRRRTDGASGSLAWLPILCIGGACLGGMTALLVAFR